MTATKAARAFREVCATEAERLADDWNLTTPERNRVVGFVVGLAPRLRAALDPAELDVARLSDAMFNGVRLAVNDGYAHPEAFYVAAEYARLSDHKGSDKGSDPAEEQRTDVFPARNG